MKLRMFCGLFLASSVACASAHAQAAKPVVRGEAATQIEKSAWSMSEADEARFESLRAEGFDALYNLDYERARRVFKELQRLFPDHPAGPYLLAKTVWLKTLNESRRLQASLYNTESFYAKAKEKTDPKVVAEFRELAQQAKTLAETRRKQNPKDAETLYYLGVTEGVKAAFAGAVERSFYSAWRDGEEAAKRHREVLKLDPAFRDAEITVGMYDYVAATLPLLFKVGGSFMGVRGSKKRGLAALERVAREGAWARDDAKVLLIALYKRERRYADALKLARELAEKYPRNYHFKLEAADALVSQAEAERATNPSEASKLESESFELFDALLQKPSKGEAARPLDLIHFSYGQALATAGRHERAAKEYLAGASAQGAEQGLATFSRLRAAQSLDLAGKRQEAVAQYKEVLARPNVYDSHEEAQRGLKEPFKPRERSADEASEQAEGASHTGLY